MKFFDIFTKKEEKIYINSLHQKFQGHFPLLDEKKLITLSCLSGLLARVAYIDFQIDEEETINIQEALIKWVNLNEEEARFVTKIAIKEMKELAGLDTRNFCTPLNEILSKEEKFQIIEALFQLASSDGEISSIESNEISYISKVFLLEQKHFLAARAKVFQYLSSLKKV